MSSIIQLRTLIDESKVKKLIGRRACPEDFDLLVTGPATVYKPNGERLMTVVREGISQEAIDEGYHFLHGLKKHTTQNRGAYAASPRIFKKKLDGTISRTGVTDPVRSAVVGYFDRYPRYPFCNCSPTVIKDPKGWASFHPFLKEVGDLFKATYPERHAKQMAHAAKTDPAYIIAGTPFSTVTINNTFAGGYHTDAGDFKPGFGVMAVLRRGVFRGCDLVVPRYRVAAELRHRDIIFFDVHEVHGNTPIVDGVGEEAQPDKGGYERISIVFYLREKITECLPPAEELARAKKLRGQIDFKNDPRESEAAASPE